MPLLFNLLERNNCCVNVFSLRDKNIQFILLGEKEIDLFLEKHSSSYSRLFVYWTKAAERGKQGKSTIIDMVNGNTKYNENRQKMSQNCFFSAEKTNQF